MSSGFSIIVLAVVLLGAPSGVIVAQQKPYTEGSITVVTYVRTKPGRFDDYLRYLQTDWKRLQEESKKAGLLSSYSVASSLPRDERDWDLLLIETYPNMAALDGLDDKYEPILARLIGPEGKRTKEFVDRGAIRDIVGARLMRELKLK